jgi:hypothetical protein
MAREAAANKTTGEKYKEGLNEKINYPVLSNK